MRILITLSAWRRTIVGRGLVVGRSRTVRRIIVVTSSVSGALTAYSVQRGESVAIVGRVRRVVG